MFSHKHKANVTGKYKNNLLTNIKLNKQIYKFKRFLGCSFLVARKKDIKRYVFHSYVTMVVSGNAC